MTEKKGERDKDQGGKGGRLADIQHLRKPGGNPSGTIQAKCLENQSPQGNHENQERQIDFKRRNSFVDGYDAGIKAQIVGKHPGNRQGSPVHEEQQRFKKFAVLFQHERFSRKMLMSFR